MKMDDEGIQVLVTGDTHLGGGWVKELAQNNEAEKLFGNFLSLIKEADLSITNLESPLIEGGIPKRKTGPNLKSPVNTLEVLREGGFNLVTLANNHIMDYGAAGLNSTLRACSQIGISTVGAGRNLKEASKTFYFTKNGIKVAIINIAENEFGTTTGSETGAHSLNSIQNFYTIQDATNNADQVIVIIHGGHEYYSLPSPRMQETYRYFVDVGADAVVGHHPHCYSGYEIYKGAPIFYSLGNFLFDKEGREKNNSWNLGFLVLLRTNKDTIDFDIIPYFQNHNEPGLRKLNDEEHAGYKQDMTRLNEIITNKVELEKSFVNYCKNKRKLYSSYIEPYSGWLLHALRNRGLFPSVLSKRKKRLLLNLMRCEAHRDVLINLLEYENSDSQKEK